MVTAAVPDAPMSGGTVLGVDPSADRALHRQLADLIRAQIEEGVFVAGQRLPAQKDYVQEHGVSRDTVERAMTALRLEGLIVTSRRGSRVRRPATPALVRVGWGRVAARIPTEPERRELGIGEGVAVLVIKRDGCAEVMYPGDKVEIEISPGGCWGAER